MPRRVQALADGRFAIGGSWAPMVLMLAIFLQRYTVGVAIAVVPAWAHNVDFALAASLLGGLPTGLLVARALRVLAHGRRTGGLALA
jgi:hypothetical protein